jgi:hypothetical protein
MTGVNNKDKRGFSGLLDLASEVSDINEPIKPEPKGKAIVDVDVEKESQGASRCSASQHSALLCPRTRH